MSFFAVNQASASASLTAYQNKIRAVRNNKMTVNLIVNLMMHLLMNLITNLTLEQTARQILKHLIELIVKQMSKY